MRMTLQQRIRTFLGIDALPSRLEMVEIRQLIESNHRELLEILDKNSASSSRLPIISNYSAGRLDWDGMQIRELAEMIANQPKEES